VKSRFFLPMKPTKAQQQPEGLNYRQAAERRAQFGTNFLPELPTPPIWKKFLLQFAIYSPCCF